MIGVVCESTKHSKSMRQGNKVILPRPDTPQSVGCNSVAAGLSMMAPSVENNFKWTTGLAMALQIAMHALKKLTVLQFARVQDPTKLQ